jgi:hypothetical protein
MQQRKSWARILVMSVTLTILFFAVVTLKRIDEHMGKISVSIDRAHSELVLNRTFANAEWKLAVSNHVAIRAFFIDLVEVVKTKPDIANTETYTELLTTQKNISGMLARITTMYGYLNSVPENIRDAVLAMTWRELELTRKFLIELSHFGEAEKQLAEEYSKTLFNVTLRVLQHSL